MASSRKLQIAALGLVCALLLLGVFFFYLRNSEGSPLELTGGAPETGNQQATENSPAAMLIEPVSQPKAATSTEPSIRVYIAGAVQKPDVYTLKPGDRLVDGVQAAGGGADDADLESVNLALRVRGRGLLLHTRQVHDAGNFTGIARIGRIGAGKAVPRH